MKKSIKTSEVLAAYNVLNAAKYGSMEDADKINFSDKFIYQELDKPKTNRMIPAIHIADSTAIRAFEMWTAKEDKILY